MILTLMAMCAPVLLAVDSNRSLDQYTHRIWQSQPGLPQAPIFAIAQDREGFIWLGTQNGVARFDGVRFSPVPALEHHPLRDAWVSNLIADKTNAVWIRTNDNKLVRVSGRDVKAFGEADGMQQGSATCLAAASDGGVWVCTPEGLLHFQGDKADFHAAPNGKFEGTPTNACESEDHTVWIGNADAAEIFMWSGESFTTRKLRLIPKNAGVRSIRCTDGRLWVGTEVGLIEISGATERRFSQRDGFPDNFVIDLGKTHSGGLWIGTRKGLSRYHNGAFSNYGARDGLSQSTVYAIFEDRENSVWVGTNNGLNQFVDSEAVLYTTLNGIPSDNMGPVIEDSRGRLWGGTLGGGLFRYDGRRFTTIQERDGLSSNFVNSLGVAPQSRGREDTLWVGTRNGLNRLQNDRINATYTESQGLPSRDIHAIHFDRSGVLWVATAQGVARLSGDRFVPVSNQKELQTTITALGETKGGDLLFATQAGSVYLHHQGALEKIAEQHNFRDLQAFYTDKEGNVWLGTFGSGLVLWNGSRFTAITMQHGLPDGQVLDILGDGSDRLWIACSSGYYSVSRKNLLDFAAGKTKRVYATAFSARQRLRTIESQADVQPALWKSRNGSLWFSTIRGLLNLDPTKRDREATDIDPIIDSVDVNGETVMPGDIERLAPGNKSLTIHYTALTFLRPEQMRFRYRLQGYDTDWVDAGTRREAYYTNLSPGDYRFEVQSCTTDGGCDETGTSVRFALAPHWYQAVWFAPACLLTLGLLAFGGYRLRIRALRHELLVVVGERNRIARELHDTLIQGFSGITMQLQALSGRIRGTAEHEVLGEIIRDAGRCLRETRRSVAGLRAEGARGAGLASALAEAARHATEQKGIRLRLNIADQPYDIPEEVKYNLVRIAQEAITNSVKHSGAHTIDVELDQRRDTVQITITDDGDGFINDEETLVKRPLHYGIVGMHERAEQIGGRLHVASAPGRGTQVRISVPLHSRLEAAEIEETVQ